MSSPSTLVGFAPGKLIWLGEYAVLDGAPSLVQAVPQGCKFGWLDAPYLAISSSLWPTPIRVHQGILESPPHGADLLVATLAEAGAAGLPLASLTGLLTLDSSSMADGAGAKFGFGSSAATAAALSVALAHRAGRFDPAFSAALAHAAHLRFQQGAGSGIDVETSLHGGLSQLSRTPDGGRLRQPIAPPEGLAVAVLLAGASCDTRAMLRQLKSVRGVGSVESAMQRLVQLSTLGAEALRLGAVADFLAVVTDFVAAEQALGAAADLPIINEPVLRCIQAATAAGWVAKPSGAGGGDIVVAFTDRLHLRESLSQSCSERSIPLLHSSVAPSGALHFLTSDA